VVVFSIFISAVALSSLFIVSKLCDVLMTSLMRSKEIIKMVPAKELVNMQSLVDLKTFK